MKNAILKILNNIYKSEGRNVYNSNDLYFVVNNSRCAEIVYVFLRGRRIPLCVCKITMDYNLKKHLKIEASALSAFKLLDDSCLKDCVPHIIWEGETNKHYIVLESFCSGISMSEYIFEIRKSHKAAESVIYSITEWLIRIAKMNKEDGKNNILSLANLTEEAIQGYLKVQYLSDYEKKAICELYSGLANEDKFVKTVFQHGDLSPFNVVYNKESKAFFVLDWGYANFRGVPLIDLFCFLLNFFTQINEYQRAHKRRIILKPFMKNVYRPRPKMEDFLLAFYKKGWQREITYKYINKYCNSLGISKYQREVLFLIFVLRHLYYDKEFLSVWFNRDKADFINFYFMAERKE